MEEGEFRWVIPIGGNSSNVLLKFKILKRPMRTWLVEEERQSATTLWVYDMR